MATDVDLAKLTQHAMALRTAEQISDAASAKRVQPLIDAASKDACAARAAAGDDVTWAAARAAAWTAAWDESLQDSALGLLDRMITAKHSIGLEF